MEQFDVVVIGAGPGGYVAAIRSAQLGFKTAIIENEKLGGVCLNWGCIPTKALLKAAELYSNIQHADIFGIKVEKVTFDITKIVGWSRSVSEKLSGGISHLMKKNKIQIIEGFARINKDKSLAVEKNGKTQMVKAKHIIIATGANARTLPNLTPDGEQIWTAREAMVPKVLPKSLLIVGSGAIGIEFASFYNSFGVEVTVVEMQNRILPAEDLEISELAKKSFEKQGIKILTESTIKSLKKNKNTVECVLDTKGKESKITAEKILVAVGVVGNTEGFGLENTKIKVEKNQIVANEFYETAEPGFYAIGDVAGGPWLAHKASHEAIICLDKIAGKTIHPLNKSNIPGCTYSHPQIASVGFTEAKAKELGYKLKIGRFPYVANGKAIAGNNPEGMVKVIFDEKTGELLGAHMIGHEVTEMIQGYVVGKTMEATEEDFMHSIFPHPTMSEAMHEAVLDAFGRVIHF